MSKADLGVYGKLIRKAIILTEDKKIKIYFYFLLFMVQST